MQWRKWILGEWNWKRPFKSLAFIYVVLAITACGFSNKFIFQPQASQYTPNASRLEMLTGSEGEQIAAFWYPPAKPDGPVLLWSHGNAEDIGALVPLHRELATEGFGLLAYDYPGFGLSEGSPNEAGCYAAIQAAHTHLLTEKKIAPSRIFIVGQSVGSGPACWLAEREDTAGLILLSPFLSAFRTVTTIPLFPGDKFPNIHRIKKIDEPILVIHGTLDNTIPFSHGRKLHDLHPGPKKFLPIDGADHNTIWPIGYDEITAAFLEFTSP
jgi:abhydrolase domain-containing protein 17